MNDILSDLHWKEVPLGGFTYEPINLPKVKYAMNDLLANHNGVMARRAGISINPYPEGTSNHTYWLAGWEGEDERLSVEPETPYDYEVKSWPAFFSKMITGDKKHDMRDMRDRPYKVGDCLRLREWDPFTGAYTGRWAVFNITYITSNESPCAMSSVALDRNIAILSLELLESSQ